MMPAITTPISPVQARGEMFPRFKSQSLQQPRTSMARPLSAATEILDTDMEDESDIEIESEVDEEDSPKRSFESVSEVVLCVTTYT